jgi:HlyD family secretion protein
MKIPKVISMILALSLIGVVAAGCSKKTAITTATTQEVTVGTGTITVEATYTGSIDYANYQNLSFAVDGNVGTVNCKVGDLVKQGQVLATLDPTAWAQYIQSLTQTLQAAQRTLTTDQSTLAADQRAVTTTQLNVTQGQLAIQADQNNLATDQYKLANISAVQTAQDAVDSDQANIDAAQASLQSAQAEGDNDATSFLSVYIKTLKAELTQDQLNLKQVLDSTSTTLTTESALQVAGEQLQVTMDQLKITQDQNVLVGDQAAVDNANQAVTNAEQDVATAQAAVTTAQTNLTTDNAASTQITAPFDGAITAVNIEAGVGLSVTSSGAIKAGATAIVIADTSKFVADMMINETDIPNISVGTMATVTAAALPNITLSARVNTISPTATNQSGVVNYPVTATILGVVPQTATGTTSPSFGTRRITTTSTTTPSTSGQSGTSVTPSTTLPSGTPGQTGSLTPGQIAQFQQRFQQASTSAMSQLRQGMSLTVNLIEQQAQNVIIVPNQAIKTVSGKSYVELKTNSGTTEQQQVTSGLKDVQNTQIVSGLNVGDIILITKTTTSSSLTTTTPARGGAGLFGGGGGGGLLR